LSQPRIERRSTNPQSVPALTDFPRLSAVNVHLIMKNLIVGLLHLPRFILIHTVIGDDFLHLLLFWLLAVVVVIIIAIIFII
jgi:hypothetical protein